MSEKTQARPEFDIKWLLDNEWHVKLFKNRMGSYTATARRLAPGSDGLETEDTDHFTPADALQALVDKITKTGQFA